MIGDASVDPDNFVAAVEQILNVRFEMILGLDKGVLGFGKKSAWPFLSTNPCWRQYR